MKLYIVRHGQTEENVSQTIQGHQPGRLTEVGHEQARRVAHRLSEIRFDAIYSSDLGRVVETARYIMQFQEAPIVYDPLLRERGAGVYEGHPRQLLWDAEAQSGMAQIEFRPEGGESFLDLQARIDAFVGMGRRRHSGETILIVSHGGWNRQLLGQAMNRSIADSLDISQINTCVNIVETPEEDRYTIHLINCVSHLGPELLSSGS